MPKPRSLLDILDPKPLVKSSRLSYGSLETRGVASILFGVAAVVIAAGIGDTLRRTATMLPEALREAREFWLSVRGSPRDMLP